MSSLHRLVVISSYNSFVKNVRFNAYVAASILLVGLSVGVAWAATPETGEMDDQEFLDHLESDGSKRSTTPDLDRRRLAKLVFGLGSTLVSGKTNVRMLQTAMQLRGSTATSGREIVAESYSGYDVAVERFRSDASDFLDRPESNPLLFRVVNDGQEVCWRLDAYTRLVETYGVPLKDLVSILASREACSQFRRAAFSDPVQRTLYSALEAADGSADEIEGLQREIEELERLVDDLREIEER
jgi:hypothetical protein